MSDKGPRMVGLQADSASSEDREAFAHSLKAVFNGQSDWILLNTCHRVEMYWLGDQPAWIEDARIEGGERAVRHLIRVAAGLESAIVGEDEVLHQVREALAVARGSRPLDTRLTRLFEIATAAGRRVRAQRGTSSGNLAQRAVEWLQQKARLSGSPLLIAGAGHMGSALAHAATRVGADVTIASRDRSRAERLARVYGGKGVTLATAAEIAPRSAAVAVALAGEWRELEPGDLPPVADISAPSALTSVVRESLNGSFLGIDDLYTQLDARPRAYVEMAEDIVEAKTREYIDWLELETRSSA